MSKLTPAQQEFAQKLFNAQQTKQPLVEAEFATLVQDSDTAYLVQKEVTALKGQPVGGYKVSLTSERTQKLFDSDCPLFGRQVESKFFVSPCNLDLADYLDPLVEVELVFKAKEDLSPEDTLEDLLRKTTVAGGLEVPDSRFVDWFPNLGKWMVVSDCAVGGCVVYGQEFDTQELFPTLADLEKVNAELYHNGEKVAEGASSEVLGNPLNSLKWLVGKLAEQGETFKAGQRVSSGTFVFPPKLAPGKWECKYDSGLGNVVLEVKEKA